VLASGKAGTPTYAFSLEMQDPAEIAEYPIYVDDRPSLEIQELLASARLYIRRHGVKLVVVDYLRLVNAPGRELRDRVGHVGQCTAPTS
jgi:replicative DNA helicase